MKYAVMAPVAAGVTADPRWIGPFAQHAEACGFESITVVEHAVVIAGYSSRYPYADDGRMDLADDCPIPDPLDLLAFLAGCTTTIGLATGVLVVPNHHPVVLAKRVASVDALSRGRLRLVLGVGWMREELEACGAEFSTRGKRMDETIDVMRALWAETAPDGATFHGRFASFEHAMCYPKPFAPQGVPLHIGGHSDAAARRAGRRGDGFQPLGARGDDLARLLAVMHDEAAAAGRDPAALEVTLGHSAAAITPDKAQRLHELGADRIQLRTTATTDLGAALDELTDCAARLGLKA